jgi:hypothetical protein
MLQRRKNARKWRAFLTHALPLGNSITKKQNFVRSKRWIGTTYARRIVGKDE